MIFIVTICFLEWIVTMNLNIEDLEELGYHKLLQLSKNIDAAIKEIRKKNKKEVRDKIIMMAHENGYKLSELFPEHFGENGSKKDKSKSRFKTYRNPHNENQIWQGGGPRPKWVKEALAQGRKLEEFLFEPEAA